MCPEEIVVYSLLAKILATTTLQCFKWRQNIILYQVALRLDACLSRPYIFGVFMGHQHDLAPGVHDLYKAQAYGYQEREAW